MNSGEDIMVLIDHLKRQLRNYGTSICRKVCLEILKEAWTPHERFQSSSIATNRISVLQSNATSKDVKRAFPQTYTNNRRCTMIRPSQSHLNYLNPLHLSVSPVIVQMQDVNHASTSTILHMTMGHQWKASRITNV